MTYISQADLSTIKVQIKTNITVNTFTNHWQYFFYFRELRVQCTNALAGKRHQQESTEKPEKSLVANFEIANLVPEAYHRDLDGEYIDDPSPGLYAFKKKLFLLINNFLQTVYHCFSTWVNHWRINCFLNGGEYYCWRDFFHWQNSRLWSIYFNFHISFMCIRHNGSKEELFISESSYLSALSTHLSVSHGWSNL